jgi:hypothetical protein
VLGKRGLEINGQLLAEGAECDLVEGDTIEIRKKRFMINFPTEQEKIKYIHAEVRATIQLSSASVCLSDDEGNEGGTGMLNERVGMLTSCSLVFYRSAPPAELARRTDSLSYLEISSSPPTPSRMRSTPSRRSSAARQSRPACRLRPCRPRVWPSL